MSDTKTVAMKWTCSIREPLACLGAVALLLTMVLPITIHEMRGPRCPREPQVEDRHLTVVIPKGRDAPSHAIRGVITSDELDRGREEGHGYYVIETASPAERAICVFYQTRPTEVVGYSLDLDPAAVNRRRQETRAQVCGQVCFIDTACVPVKDRVIP